MSDLQSDVAIANGNITGTLRHVDSGALARDWGPGNFIALAFAPSEADTTATTYKVGVIPSEGSGLVELDSDMDAVLKVTDKDAQRLVVVTSDGSGHETTQTYGLTGLTCEVA